MISGSSARDSPESNAVTTGAKKRPELPSNSWETLSAT
jgi:hypothetical protein